jgi:predicted DNA-binding transcriptional regulator AlpA
MSDTTPATLPSDAVAAMLDVWGVARLLQCSVRHVRRLADRDAMPRPVRLGALTRWRRVEIDRWIESGCPASPKRAATAAR